MPFSRYVSLALRRRRSRQECVRTLRAFLEWREPQRQLTAPNPRQDTLLIIRLDDIGDYLLFRNQLAMYKRSARWQSHKITLLGNTSWKELFAAFDVDTVDATLWVDKGAYLTSADYRSQIWTQLRDGGFETVIAPSRTRPLLLDDLCRLAAAPVYSIGCVNTYVHASWNEASDALYEALFAPIDDWVHEFRFNGQFAAWACGEQFPGSRPRIGVPPRAPPVTTSSDVPSPAADRKPAVVPVAATPADLICFIGANTRSRRWPASRWMEFIVLYGRVHGGSVVLAGNGSVERELAARIQQRTNAHNIVGQVSLLELILRIRAARAVVSNDTMAVHLSVACGRPTVIVANGVNHQRFTDYDAAGISGVATLYPRVFTRRRNRDSRVPYNYADALTSDIASITAGEVLTGLDTVLKPWAAEPPA